METLPLCTSARTLPSPALEIPARLTIRHEATEDELDLIEIRYQHALALLNLEDLFAEGQLDYL